MGGKRVFRNTVGVSVTVLGLCVGAVQAVAIPANPTARTALPTQGEDVRAVAEPTGPGAEVLPPGWRAVPSPQGEMLEWTSPSVLPVSAAPIMVRVGSTEVPAAVRGTTVIVARSALPRDLRGLQVMHRGLPVLSSTTLVAPQGRSWDVGVAGTTPRARAAVASATYTAGSLRAPGMPSPLAISGKIIAPQQSSGPRPVVLFAHGRHQWCYAKAALSYEWPCKKGFLPVPSSRGYEYLQNELAGLGYITVSIDLNAINAQDNADYGMQAVNDAGITARGNLIRAHLSQLAAWNSAGNAPFKSSVAAEWDMSKVVLVGHSRGGDGVVRAASMADAADPFTIRGLVPLAPTNFDRRTPGYVPTLTVLPGCDGDVSDLQGQSITDRSLDMGRPTALHTSVYIPGANHNFFNTEWTPGPSIAPSDDDARSTCPMEGRQTPAQQRHSASLLITTAVKAFVEHDPEAMAIVQGATGTVPGWQGKGTLRVTPVGGQRTPIWRGNLPGTPFATVTRASMCTSGVICAPDTFDQMTPHWQSGYAGADAPAAVLGTGGVGKPAVVRWSQPQSAGDMPFLEARIVVPPRARVGWKVRVIDANGNGADLVPVAGASMCGAPCGALNDDSRGRWLAQTLRVDVRGAAGVDVQRLSAVELTSTSGPARVLLLDIHLSAMSKDPNWRDPQEFPRLDVASKPVKVAEGSVPHTVDIPVTFSAPLPAPITLRAGWTAIVGLPAPGSRKPNIIEVPAGATSASIPVHVPGNTIDDDDLREVQVSVESRGPVRVAGASGTVFIVDDDPTPTLTLTPVTTTVREGRTLTWKATLSAKSNRQILIRLSARAPGGPEVAVTDLTRTSREEWQTSSVKGAVPLSRAKAMSVWLMEPGMLTRNLFMGTVKDSRREPTKKVQCVASVTAAQLRGSATLSGVLLGG